MKLTSLRVFQEEIPLTQPFTISYHTTESTILHFVEWQTDTGHHGWGSASPGQRVTGETDVACNAALQAMSALQGEDVRHLPRLLRYLETEF
ncbi:MAG: dipeptide epimerase, partial [SAR324 cluster bacterium]|nr:dipeptide epimerase [SAR324 cluster bacterium]